MRADAPRPVAAPTLATRSWVRHPTVRVLLVVAVVVLLSALQALRQAGFRSWNTIWAEDGTVYLKEGNQLSALFHTYAGYLQLVPRLVGLGANLVPLDQVARYLTAMSAVVTSLCAIAIFTMSKALVPSVLLRGLLAASTFLAPGVLGENLNSPTNLIWVLLFACWWALLVAPTSRSHAVVAATISFFAVMSSVLALLYLPFAALLAWKRRSLDSRIVLGAFGVAALMQTWFVVTADDPEGAHVTHLGDLIPIYGVRVLGSGVFGDSLVRTAWLDHGYAVAWIAAAVVLAIVGFLALRTVGVHRCLGLVSVVYSAGMFLFAVARRGSDGFMVTANQWNYNGGRFVVLSLWILFSGVAVLASGARISVTAKRVLVALIVTQFAVVAVANYRATNGRSPGPAWNEQVTAAKALCRTQPRTTTAAIPIAPPGWYATLSCDRVLG